ncbi:response regulator transcription factor, partial [Actinoplanes sp. NPDC026623]|uniref:response regulator transcription factor n=1 Tax=Actinoplanes sp. NPDC026623 TaxID=3155610 RepID=UPI0033D2453D
MIADDHPIFLAGMKLTLDSYPGLRCVAAVSTGAQSVQVALAERPDVAVLDINMPDLSGVVAARAIAADAPGVGLLMLTMLGDDESVFAALRAGARGYLLKGSTPDEVVAAIRAVAGGGALFGPGIAARIVDYFTAGPAVSREVAVGAAPLPALSEREREILTFLADGESNPAIAGRLNLSPKTVRNHVSTILAKLHVADRRQAMLRARDAGLGGPPARGGR